MLRPSPDGVILVSLLSILCSWILFFYYTKCAFPAKGNRTTPFLLRGLLFDQRLSLVICFLSLLLQLLALKVRKK